MKKILLAIIVALMVTSCVSTTKDSVNLSKSHVTKEDLKGVWHCNATDFDDEYSTVTTSEQYDFDPQTGKYLSTGFVMMTFKKLHAKPVKIDFIRFQEGEWKIKNNIIFDTSYYSRGDYFPIKMKKIVEGDKKFSALFNPYRDVLNRGKGNAKLFIASLKYDEMLLKVDMKGDKPTDVACNRVTGGQIYPSLQEPLRSRLFGRNK